MKIHIVKKGDTLYELSQKYNVDLEKLIAANPQIADPNVIDVGMKVKIPTGPKPVEPPADYLYKHVVVQGDTLWKLGKAWGIPLADMIAANPHLKNPNILLTGDVVYIPKLKQHHEPSHVSHGHVSHGHMPHGHMSQGHMSQGHMSHGHMSHGHISHGHTSHGHISHGHTSHGHMSHGHMSPGHVSPGNVSHGNISHGHVSHGQIHGSPGHHKKDTGYITEPQVAPVQPMPMPEVGHVKMPEPTPLPQVEYTAVEPMVDHTKPQLPVIEPAIPQLPSIHPFEQYQVPAVEVSIHEQEVNVYQEKECPEPNVYPGIGPVHWQEPELPQMHHFQQPFDHGHYEPPYPMMPLAQHYGPVADCGCGGPTAADFAHMYAMHPGMMSGYPQQSYPYPEAQLSSYPAAAPFAGHYPNPGFPPYAAPGAYPYGVNPFQPAKEDCGCNRKDDREGEGDQNGVASVSSKKAAATETKKKTVVSAVKKRKKKPVRRVRENTPWLSR
ncbi:LysM peptidoglycan-binding domain-containing protein [Paenibacillus hamazuiensis]|uniref:LysM peptidoglycan-binding domain-containing protein n=1 Tax=Paenibacillus hamazuiensis TaxID=2936508 RepID=UPI00200DCA56